MPEDKKEGLEKITPENLPEVLTSKETEGNPENIGRFEKISSLETITEKQTQKINDTLDEREGELGGIVSIGQQRKASAARAKDIEKILEKGLDEIYLAMPPAKRAEFKTVGERTTAQINELIEIGKISMKKIIGLIRSWLLIIPGVNKFFLEQETKIKADEIMKISKIDKKSYE